MALVTSWTQAQVEALEQSIAEGLGAGTMTFGDQTVTFDSLDARIRLLAYMRRTVAAAAGTQPSTRYASVSKGV